MCSTGGQSRVVGQSVLSELFCTSKLLIWPREYGSVYRSPLSSMGERAWFNYARDRRYSNFPFRFLTWDIKNSLSAISRVDQTTF